MSSRMASRTAGKVGRRRPLVLSFPHCGFEPTILEEGVSDHRHERMSIQALPASALKVGRGRVLPSAVGELASKSSAADGGRHGAQVGLRGKLAIIFLFSRSPMSPMSQTSLPEMLLALVPDPLRRSAGNLHASSRTPSRLFV
jgi:hypothetical protein